MNDVLHHLQTRNSAPRLQAPAPSAEELEQIFQAGLRAPDHAWLRPWRFIVIEGERREDFGEVLERCLLQRDPAAHISAREKARGAPLRAPLLLVVVARLQEHPKVPHSEQRLSAGCAAHAILLAAEALGYAGIWRTGNAAFDPFVGAALGLEPGEEVVSFLYLGTRDGNPKTLPTLNTADFVNRW
jgi:nitroreductase